MRSLRAVKKTCPGACSQTWALKRCIWIVCDPESTHCTHIRHQLVHLLVSYACYGPSCRRLYLGSSESKGRGAAWVFLYLCGERSAEVQLQLGICWYTRNSKLSRGVWLEMPRVLSWKGHARPWAEVLAGKAAEGLNAGHTAFWYWHPFSAPSRCPASAG